MEDYSLEDENGVSCWESWYLSGVYGFDPKKPRGVGPWEQEWQEELERRSQSRKLTEAEYRYQERLQEEVDKKQEMLQDEMSLGAIWICLECRHVYRVKTPFLKLYCSNCLTELKDRRILPLGKLKFSYWMLEE